MNSATWERIAASSADEVLAALADGHTAVLAGGQSLIPDQVERGAAPGRVVDINGVAAFDVLSESDGVLTIAPLVRHRAFETDVVGGPLGNLLSLVVRNMGHPPVRDRGTVLGSVAYAHPAAEWPA